MKRLGAVFRGPGEEQKYIVEIGESELRRLERVANVPDNIVSLVCSLHWTAKELNELLATEPTAETK